MKLFDELEMMSKLPKDYIAPLRDMYDTLGATIYSNKEELYLRSNELAALTSASSSSIHDITDRIDKLEEAMAFMQASTEELSQAFQAMSQRLAENKDRIQAEKEKQEKQELYKQAIELLSEYISAETEKSKSDLEKIEPIIEETVKRYNIWGDTEDGINEEAGIRIEFGGQPIFYR